MKNLNNVFCLYEKLAMDYHRVRTLIPYLEYSSLRNAKKLPKKLLFTKVKRGGKLPLLSKKMGYSKFGLFMEDVISKCLTERDEDLYDVIDECCHQLHESYHRYFRPNDYLEIGEMVRDHFEETPTFEPEWTSGEIVGHPDIVDTDCVYDIKTTGRFNAMRTSTIFQILSYYCLAQLQDLPVTHIGLILPAQRIIFYEDISEWDWKPFWKELEHCISLKNQRESLYKVNIVDYMTFNMMTTVVGSHIHKDQVESMINDGCPFQFFLGGNSSSRITSITKKLSTKLYNRLSPMAFIHAPYCINLSRPKDENQEEAKENWITEIKKRGKKLTMEEKTILKSFKKKYRRLPWACYVLVKILETGHNAGINGIVVHCGKKKGKTEKQAVDKMRESLETVSVFIENDTPCFLLLETSSGDGGETLCDPKDLASFYNSLSSKAKKKTGICIDTCHVFAAGFEPMHVIKTLEEANVPIKLIHYNDSMMAMGSKRDRHAGIGNGYLGFDRLFNVLQWAMANDVPCVTE